jgi:hypothetical protein
VKPPEELWQEALRAAYSTARGTRLQELRGRHPKKFDDRGLHVLSVEVGRIFALQELYPELAHADFNVLDLYREANRDATEAFMEEWEEKKDAQHAQERS